MSELNANLNPATNLNGSLTDASALAGSLNLDDNITGSLTGEHVLNGSLTPTSTMSGLLGIYGEGGTSDYNELDNKPSINNVTLQGNKTTEDLGLFSGKLQDIAYSDLQDNGILWTAYSNGKWGLNSPASIKYLSDVSYRDPMVENGDLLKAVQHGSYASWELGKPSPVVWSGDYNDLINKPDIPGGQVNADWNATSGVAEILNKPTLATVATSGSYNDLTNKPTIPAAQVNSDWSSNSGVSQILNKPTLATVATSGSYNDLTNKPTIPAAQVNSDWSSNSGVSQILNKPTLATVATSGSYNDLSNKPTIPAAQVNSDWNASSGIAQILNKPTLATVATSGSYNDLTDKPTIPTDFYIPYRDTETQIGTWLDGVTPVYQKYIDLGGTKTLAPNTNVNLAPLAGNILLLGGGCIRIDTSYTGYFPYIQLVANGTYLQGNNIRSSSVGVNAVLIQYVYRS